MADQGLFGPSPWEIQQAQQANQQQRMMDMSKMDATQMGKYGMLSAGSGLGGMLAQSMGGRNVAVENAQRTEQIMGADNTDLGTSAGMMAKADQFRKAGDLRTASALALKANELKRQEAAAALAAQKQTLDERKFDEGTKEKMRIDAEAKAAALAQQAQIAEQRSQDLRYSAEQRAEAAKYAADARREIAGMVAALKQSQGGIEKPMTAAQQLKQKQAENKSMGGVRLLDDTVDQTKSLINQIEKHPGLGGATGARGMLPSMPGWSAQQAETLISEFKAQTSLAGLNLTRQGGGIGAMTEKEWPLVERMVAGINPRDGKDAMVAQMKKVQAKIEQIRENAKMGHSETFGGDTPQPPDPTKPKNNIIRFDAQGNMVK